MYVCCLDLLRNIVEVGIKLLTLSSENLLCKLKIELV